MAAVVLAGARWRWSTPACPRARGSCSCIVVGAIVFIPLCAWRVPEVRARGARRCCARFFPKPIPTPHRRSSSANLDDQPSPDARRLGGRRHAQPRRAAGGDARRPARADPRPRPLRGHHRRRRLERRHARGARGGARAGRACGSARVRQEQGGGPARARNRGWRMADGADDRLHRRRLRAHARLARGDAGRRPASAATPSSRGRRCRTRARSTRSTRTRRRCTSPAPRRTSRPATSSIRAPCSSRSSGFDETYPAPAGEDSDLGWRVKDAGGVALFAPDAVVHHAVFPRTPAGRAQGRADGDARRPGVQAQPRAARAPDPGRVLRALAPADAAGRVRALALPPQPGGRGVRRAVRDERPRPRPRREVPVKAAAFHVAYDAVQIAATVRGAVRHRFPLL